MRKLRILLLVHEDTVPPKSIDGLSEEEIKPFKAEFDVARSLESLGHQVHVLGVTDTLASVREAIEEFKPHVAFNLLLHFQGIGLYDAHVVSFLELRHVPYTGVNPRGLLLAHDKALTKKILSFHRIRCPRFAVFQKGKRVRRPAKLEFPLIVKSLAEHASQGIAQASIVHDDEALAERVEFIHRNVSPGAIAEQYIPGRELTVGVMGNQRLEVFPVWELFFDSLPASSEPIATSRVKWDYAYQQKIGLRSGPAEDLDEALQREIQRTARRIYKALGLSGYARIDLRLSEDGKVYVIEANPNPDLSYGEDFSMGAHASGYDYAGLLQKLLNLGLRYQAPWRLL